MCAGISRQITTVSSGLKVNIRKVKMHIWGLFDDGNGCYRQAVDEYNMNTGEQHTITSIGIGDACIN